MVSYSMRAFVKLLLLFSVVAAPIALAGLLGGILAWGHVPLLTLVLLIVFLASSFRATLASIPFGRIIPVPLSTRLSLLLWE